MELVGADCIADVPYGHHYLFEPTLLAASVIDTRAYFAREDPDAIFTEDGARLCGLLREHAERHGLPGARWGQWQDYVEHEQ